MINKNYIIKNSYEELISENLTIYEIEKEELINKLKDLNNKHSQNIDYNDLEKQKFIDKLNLEKNMSYNEIKDIKYKYSQIEDNYNKEK